MSPRPRKVVSPPPRRRPLRSAVRVANVLFSVACLLLAVAVFGPTAKGYQHFVITGQSMTGSIDRGSLAFGKPVPTATLRTGDVITFTPPGQWRSTGLVTHRIVSISRDGEGRRLFRTRGDHNRVTDPWQFVITAPTQTRYAFHIPYVGYLLGALANGWIRLLVCGIPALLLAVSLLRSIWRQAGERVAREASACSG